MRLLSMTLYLLLLSDSNQLCGFMLGAMQGIVIVLQVTLIQLHCSAHAVALFSSLEWGLVSIV